MSEPPDQLRLLEALLFAAPEPLAEDDLARRLGGATDGGADVGALDHVPERIAALTGDAIQLAAQTYLNTGNYVEVTLMPETK